MKICAISFHCCPFSLLGGDGTGGMNVYLREFCSQVSNFSGSKIDVFTRVQNPRIRGIRHFSPQARVVHLKGGPERPVDRRKLYDFLPEFFENLKEFIIRGDEQYDLIYTHYWLSGLVGEWLKCKLDLPLVHMYHTLAFMKTRALKHECGENRNRIESEEHLAHISDAIISSSGHEKQSLTDEYKIPSSKIKVIYPGVNKNLFQPQLDQIRLEEIHCNGDEEILLFVGRIDPVKGLMTVIEAFEFLRQRAGSLYHKLKLIVVGGGRKSQGLPQNEEFIRIKEFIKRKNLMEKVIFLGSKKQSQLSKYYSAADALVVPSLYESFGLVMIEALACGTPVIVSRVGEMGSLVQQGKTGYSFYPNDPSSLSQALEYLFSHRDNLWKKDKIRQNTITKFSWEKTAEKTYSFLKKIKRERTFLTTRFQPGESLPQV